MLKNSFSPVRFPGLFCAALALYSFSAATSGTAAERPASQTERLNPFTNQVHIPADADLSSIRFASIRLVNVATSLKRVSDVSYCAQLQFREPGGSNFCPDVRTASVTSAYRVTYSYLAQPLLSDESGNRAFTFDLYFRPEEIFPEVRTALTNNKTKQAGAERYFMLTFHDQLTNRTVVDSVPLDLLRRRICGRIVDRARARLCR